MNTPWTQNCGIPSLKIEEGQAPHHIDPVPENIGGSTTKPAPTPTPLPRRAVMQRGAPQDLDLVSWPAGKMLPRKLKGYVYDVLPGLETYLYMIGDGLNLEHRVGSPFLCIYYVSLADMTRRISSRADTRGGILRRMLRMPSETILRHWASRLVQHQRPPDGTMECPRTRRS